jgi:beta-galactosidase
MLYVSKPLTLFLIVCFIVNIFTGLVVSAENPKPTTIKLFQEDGLEGTNLTISLSGKDLGKKIKAVVLDQNGHPVEHALVNWVILKTDDGEGYAAQKTNSGNECTVFPKRAGTVDIEARYTGGIKASITITVVTASSKEQAEAKLVILKGLMSTAKEKGIEVSREETALWMSEQFIKFADWDADHIELNGKLYEQMVLFKGQGGKLASELPDIERSEVVKMLDIAIAQLQDVIDGNVARRPAPKVDWENVSLNGSFFESKGKPVFLYDYFSKPLDQSTMDPGLYNDYLGNIDHPKALNVTFQDPNGTIKEDKLADITNRPNTNAGYLNLWHSGLPYNPNNPSNNWWGFDDKWSAKWGEGVGPEMRIGRNYQYASYDIDNPSLRKIWSSIFDKVIPETRGKAYTKLGYNLFNEPHWFTASDSWAKIPQGISEYTIQNFRTWLQKTHHNDIAELNTKWETSFKSFDDVTIEIPIDTKYTGTPMWYDWCRFNMDRVTNWLTFLNDGIVRNNPDAKTHMKIMPSVFIEGKRDHGIDLEALTEMAGMIGDDSKFRKRDWKAGDTPESWESNYSFYWQEVFMAYDFMESVSPEKAHINTELHSLSTTQFRDIDMEPEYVRSTYWLSTILGMDASLTWFWGRNADGSIEQRLIDAVSQPGGLGKSYPASVAQQPRVANELTQTMMNMNAFSEEMVRFQNQRKPIRMFYSETSAINNPNYMEDLFEMYEPMVFGGVPIGFATKNIIEKRDNHEWDVIVVRKTEIVTDDEFAAVQKYLDQGGTVIIDNVSFKHDEYNNPRKATLKKSNGKLIKIDDGAINATSEQAYQKIKSQDKPSVVLMEDNGGMRKGSFWRVVPNGNNSYLMSIVNMGKNQTTIQLKTPDNKEVSITNMMTGNQMASGFTMNPEGVLLLEIKSTPEPCEDYGK